MIWPEPKEFKIIPEGHYSFRLNKEPELKSFEYTDKTGQKKEGRKVLIYAVGLNDTGEYSVVDAFLPSEPRYKELCAVLGVQHSRDIQVAGSFFEGDIRHDMDKKDPTKSWPRIVNITAQADVTPLDVPPAANGAGDDIPF